MISKNITRLIVTFPEGQSPKNRTVKGHSSYCSQYDFGFVVRPFPQTMSFQNLTITEQVVQKVPTISPNQVFPPSSVLTFAISNKLFDGSFVPVLIEIVPVVPKAFVFLIYFNIKERS